MYRLFRNKTLDQKIKQPQEITEKLHQVAGVLKNMNSDEFKQFIVWFQNVLKLRMPETLQEKLEHTIDQINPWEVEKMIYNIETSLEEMQQQALRQGELRGLEKGREEGRIGGKAEVARELILMHLDVEQIIKATGLSREKIAQLRKELAH